ncbi:hypothetical protein DPI70_24545 [Escherichia coli]|nr:hypothetical protein [Escherichia coli]
MNHTNKKAGAPFPARLIAVSLPPEKALITPSVFPVLQKSLRPCPSANRKGRPPATPFRHIRYSPPQNRQLNPACMLHGDSTPPPSP